MIKKIGSPQKISKVIKDSAFSLDPNLIVKKLKDQWKGDKITLDQVHEIVKSLGVMDYSSEDMNHLVELLQSSGLTVLN